MRVMVLIEKVETGERRWYDDGLAHEATEYMWDAGNYSCDCNRSAFFQRAGHEDEVWFEECGDKAYKVWLVLREDGHFYNVER